MRGPMNITYESIPEAVLENPELCSALATCYRIARQRVRAERHTKESPDSENTMPYEVYKREGSSELVSKSLTKSVISDG